MRVNVGFYLCLLLVSLAQCEDLYSDTFYHFAASPSIRVLSRNGTFGSTSVWGGINGIIYPVLSEAGLAAFFSSTPTMGPMAVLLNGTLLSLTTVEKLFQIPSVHGIMVSFDPKTIPPVSSPEGRLPRPGDWHAEAKYPWNPYGDGLMEAKFARPLLLLSEADSAFLIACGQSNVERAFAAPVYWAHANIRMLAQSDSVTCLKRGLCGPIGGLSLWGHEGDLTDAAAKPRETVWLVAPFDSASAFLSLAPGGASEMAAVSALVGAVGAVHEYLRTHAALPMAFVYGLFDAEAWGATGSKKADGSCANPPMPTMKARRPFKELDLAKVRTVIGLGELYQAEGGMLHVHSEHGDPHAALVSTIVGLAQEAYAAGAINMSATAGPAETPGLPPCPAASFLGAIGGSAIQAAHIAGHGAHYLNPHRHSHYDLFHNASLACPAATLAARAALLSMGAPRADLAAVTADCTLVGQLAEALSRNMSSPWVRAMLGGPARTLPSEYAGVSSGADPTLPRLPAPRALVFRALARATGGPAGTCEADSRCEGRGQCINGTCYLGLQGPFAHPAHSPALRYQSGGWAFRDPAEEPAIATAPLWAESNWDRFVLRIYVAHGLGAQLGVFFGGLGALVLAEGIVIAVRARWARMLHTL
ncbi:putative Nicastrin [Paratrimastix pyriformis]|uniref:Nicastrin n=1 Tax=Paratrimastix pyriformis TaxID=342808 RepID=A0ABQ8UHS9_9EUKA|nr:putative Nicastrin [Paratrimastix pyriformis]